MSPPHLFFRWARFWLTRTGTSLGIGVVMIVHEPLGIVHCLPMFLKIWFISACPGCRKSLLVLSTHLSCPMVNVTFLIYFQLTASTGRWAECYTSSLELLESGPGNAGIDSVSSTVNPRFIIPGMSYNFRVWSGVSPVHSFTLLCISIKFSNFQCIRSKSHVYTWQ